MRELFKGKRKDTGKYVYGYYWYIEEHTDPTLSEKPFIKSLNNGLDYEVDPETVEPYTALDQAISYIGIGTIWKGRCESFGYVEIVDVHPLSKEVSFRGCFSIHRESYYNFTQCYKYVGMDPAIQE